MTPRSVDEFYITGIMDVNILEQRLQLAETYSLLIWDWHDDNTDGLL